MIYFCRKTIEKQENHTKQTECARELLLAGLCLEYGIERLPAIAAAELGKPYFPEMPQIFFNYSHCRKGILCGISSSPIGVDMETVRDYKEPLIRRVCHEQESSFLQEAAQKNRMLTRIWVAKEAYLKYLGTGIRSDMRLLDMSAAVRQDKFMYGGCFLRLWEQEEICMCACTEAPYRGALTQLEI